MGSRAVMHRDSFLDLFYVGGTENLNQSINLEHRTELCSADKGKERKSIYTAPFTTHA